MNATQPPATRRADFLRLNDLGPTEIGTVLASAAYVRAEFAARRPMGGLEGRRFAAIWDGTGFRNRVAFELGIRWLGGEIVEVPVRPGHSEPLDDLAGYLDNWFDGLVVRTPNFARLRTLAESMNSPVVNARTSQNHPCEILGDLAFILDRRGPLDGLEVVFVGAATNLLGSWLEAASALPIRLTQVCPPGHEYSPEWIDGDVRGEVQIARTLAAVETADVIYTDAWPADDGHRDAAFGALRITAGVLDAAPDACMFLPCPPVTRGDEVDNSAMVHRKCAVPAAKEWLLHAQAALLLHLFGESP